MTLALPPALRRTGSKAAPGAERLTFHREHAAQLIALDEGTLVSLPNGERFEVLDTTTDMTGRPTLVVRSATHHEEEEPMTGTATAQPTELATVEVSVESSLAAADGSGGLGRVSVSVPLAPKPDSIVQGLGVSGLELALTYAQPADVEAIEAAAEATGEPFFSVPGIGVMKITGKKETPNGHVFRAINGSCILGDETLRRRQVAQNRAYDAGKIAAQNAEVERRASDTARQERFAAVDAAFDAMPRQEQLAFLASRVAHLQGPERFRVTSPAAIGLT